MGPAIIIRKSAKQTQDTAKYRILSIYALEWAYLEIGRMKKRSETLSDGLRNAEEHVHNGNSTTIGARYADPGRNRMGKSGILSTSYQHRREQDKHGIWCSMTYCPQTQDCRESRWWKRLTAHCARIPRSTDSRNVGWGRNMGMDPYTVGGDTQNGPKTPSPGWLLGPVSDFGHIWLHCGS